MNRKKDKKNAFTKLSKGLKQEWNMITWKKQKDILKEAGMIAFTVTIIGILTTGADTFALALLSMFQ